MQALYAHINGDDESAIASIADALHLADQTEISPPPTLIGHLVAGAMRHSALTVIEILCGEFDGASATRKSGAPAIRSMISQLLDESKSRSGFSAAVFAERAIQLDGVRCLSTVGFSAGMLLGSGPTSSISDAFGRRVFGPFWMLDGMATLSYVSSVERASRAQSWPEAVAQVRDLTEPVSDPIRAATRLPSLMVSNLSQVLKADFRSLATRRMAATALAIRLYELDRGDLPNELSVLVPDYLPAIPRDPFATNGREIGFRRDRPRLYSIGEDGIDQTGASGEKPNGDIDPLSGDYPFFLHGTRPPPEWLKRERASAAKHPTSTESLDDQDEVDDSQRHQQNDAGRKEP